MAALGILGMLAVGSALLSCLIGPRTWRLGAVGWWVLLGWSAVGLVMLACAAAGIAWGRWLPPAVVLSVVVAVVVVRRPPKPALRWSGLRHPGWIAVLLVTGSVPLILFVRYALVTPTWGWDMWTVWAFKARVFFEAAGIPSEVLTDPRYAHCQQGYPVLWPLAMDWLYLCLGAADERAAQLVPLSAYAGILLTMGCSLGARVRPPIAVGALLIYLYAPGNFNWVLLGYPDPYLQLAYLLGLLALERFYRRRQWADLLLLFLAAGSAAWCKMEGVVMFGAAALGLLPLLVAERDCRRRVLAAAACGIAIMLPWQVYRLSMGYRGVRPYELTPDLLAANLRSVPYIIRYWFGQLAHWRWAGFWFGFAGLLLIAGRQLRPQLPLLLYLSVPLTFSCAVYILTLPDLTHSMFRLIGHTVPAAICCAAMLGNTLIGVDHGAGHASEGEPADVNQGHI